ncbi:CrcB family protein (plasmid) [Mycolicibacterium rufum]|uniref:Fluoride-specific ion channel FluC n=1 Tax=Mycolicibacterium rufum TaxID=318424 RepID=A0ABY3URJ5_9MYCO|nr:MULTISPECIES: CrcB family protein [Mycobacteriaceae]KGI66007.1 chromosome condensation protein CrcB [Mycolicibacterium rufum]MCX2715259.1 CrcB family protein [Mycolicibacterium sp. J2]MDO3208817.1 CrcB family protein [Mycobacteroides abscessus subsp. massiliense]ULP40039.1 CrcB family protein [Mycolicibacterium rufum]
MADHGDPTAAPPVDPDVVEPAPTPLHVRPVAIVAVAVGGLVGAPARYGLGVAFPQAAGQWPVTTFAINVAGALLLGVLLEGLTRLGPDTGWRQRVRLGVGTGVLGSFTTYSTLAVDVDGLLRGHDWWAACSYAVGSVLAGLVATVFGIAIGARIPSRREENGR